MLNRQKQLKLRRQLVFAIEAVRKVDAPHSAIRVNLHSQCLYVVRAVSAAGKVREVELDLIPSFVQSHGHCANERLDTSGGLWWGEASAGGRGQDLVVGNGTDATRT